jgi:hypothetical protein
LGEYRYWWWPVEIDRPRDTDVTRAGTGTDADINTDTGRVTADKKDTGADVPGRAPGGDGDRAAACTRYRALADAMYQVVARQRWEAAKPVLSAEWAAHKRQHPAAPDASLAIDEPVRRQVGAACKEIRETEETTVTPAMRRIEAADPDRHLTGLKHRRKGEDRMMEKVAAALEEQPDLTPQGALSLVKDAIRYTFQYPEDHYADGVQADVYRLKAAGFEQVELKNSWSEKEYKGINSRWRVTENGQLFEVQFHTRISFEAKQLTHPAYERLRNPSTALAEQDVLADFQCRVTAYVPLPPRAQDIPNYP